MSEVLNVCPKCGASGFLKLENRNTHTALVCGNCKSWIKWVGKKELPKYEKMLENTSTNTYGLIKFEQNLKKAIDDLGISKYEVMQIIDKVYA